LPDHSTFPEGGHAAQRSPGPLDHLTRFAIHDFGTFSRLCSGLHSPLRFDKERRAYQSPALDVNLKYNVRWL
jgi:hypothetical protein